MRRARSPSEADHWCKPGRHPPACRGAATIGEGADDPASSNDGSSPPNDDDDDDDDADDACMKRSRS